LANPARGEEKSELTDVLQGKKDLSQLHQPSEDHWVLLPHKKNFINEEMQNSNNNNNKSLIILLT
jgi:hypothetical protein